MQINWTKNAAADIRFWQKHNSRTIQRIKSLIDDIQKNPYSGIGKLEPLKYDLQGCWSRRITGSHRLVYKIRNNKLIILQCRYHY